MPANQRFIDQILHGAAENGVEKAELQQAINKATAGCIMQSERPGSRLFGIGSRWMMCGDYIGIDETLERLRRIEVEDVSAAAAKYLVGANVKVLAIGAEAEVSG